MKFLSADLLGLKYSKQLLILLALVSCSNANTHGVIGYSNCIINVFKFTMVCYGTDDPLDCRAVKSDLFPYSIFGS